MRGATACELLPATPLAIDAACPRLVCIWDSIALPIVENKLIDPVIFCFSHLHHHFLHHALVVSHHSSAHVHHSTLTHHVTGYITAI